MAGGANWTLVRGNGRRGSSIARVELDPGFEGKPTVKFVCLSISVSEDGARQPWDRWEEFRQILGFTFDHRDALKHISALSGYWGVERCQMSMSTVVRVSYVDHETLLIRGHYYRLIGGPLLCFRNMQALTQPSARLFWGLGNMIFMKYL